MGGSRGRLVSASPVGPTRLSADPAVGLSLRRAAVWAPGAWAGGRRGALRALAAPDLLLVWARILSARAALATLGSACVGGRTVDLPEASGHRPWRSGDQSPDRSSGTRLRIAVWMVSGFSTGPRTKASYSSTDLFSTALWGSLSSCRCTKEAFPVVAHGASWDAFTNDAKSSFEERTGSIRECRRKRLQACRKNRSP